MWNLERLMPNDVWQLVMRDRQPDVPRQFRTRALAERYWGGRGICRAVRARRRS